ncbi:PaaI family thioesterase [Frankia sp. CNm7]|uniref:PaaI family thioesterase n=1 Tax=Frankia nepalensis TaxID=1836974 RepID=A0A937RP39_9ACTN|nr:PaaI family thioesterase [Frankia nepalensis]MBL7495568.1 PaaI family thioesterase [Frankia nepalensis]MBL7508814.1 PaaI family thioesterase [Frankia nepalensis]MBL7521166.1 PaaI family thioesterase [Frankia nepalensis]MBL7630038.1 PaaI family thioesterase [Frankia nepalensis]
MTITDPSTPAPSEPASSASPARAFAAWGEPRSRTVSWHDPLRTAARAATMSGLEFLRALQDGSVPPPPIASLLGFRPVRAEPGDVLFACAPDESAYNPIGVVHGGLVCTLLDTAAACAVHSTLPAGIGYTSIEIKVNYLRPVRVEPGEPTELLTHGWVTKPGRRVAFAEGDVRDAAGRVVATASTTCLVFPLAP